MWNCVRKCPRVCKRQLDNNILFWLTVPAALYVLWFVPQVRNIWYQGPPPYPKETLVEYWVFVVALLLYYVGALFFVLDSFRVMDWLGNKKGLFSRGVWMLLWILYGRLLEWSVSASATEVVPSDGKPVGKEPRKLRRWLGAWGLLSLLVGVGTLWCGAAGDSDKLFVLAGASCRLTSLFFVLLGIWLLAQVAPQRLSQIAAWRREGKPWREFLATLRAPAAGGDLNPIGQNQVRVLGWLVVTLLAGECLWFFASQSGSVSQKISYRLYTIWSALHLLVAVMILALLADRWNRSVRIWPIRVLVVGMLVGGVWWWGGPAAVPFDDFLRDCTAEQRKAWQQAPSADAAQLEKRNEAWFTECAARIQHIKETSRDRGPFVFVAASGGGSRAAIFTALALETLGRTPIVHSKDHPIMAEDEIAAQVPAWADNIVLLSSVSGGSLATAYYVHRLDIKRPTFQAVPDLHNTTKTELVHRLHDRTLGGIENFLQKKTRFRLPGVVLDEAGLLAARNGWGARRDELKAKGKRTPEEESELEDCQKYLDLLWAESYWRELRNVDGREGQLQNQEVFSQHPELQRARWVLRSGMMDAMCLDFMAPILRGVLTPGLDRGDALARFWTDQFDWRDSTNFSGYGAPIAKRHYDKHPPLVLFNASDVAKGSRLTVGFPPLPVDLWSNVYAGKLSFERPRTFAELAPAHRISLARAVRMSSNFPWGFHVMELSVQGDGKTSSHVLDGGVVDNSGLDTLYELFHALEWYAGDDGAKKHPFHHQQARAILSELRQRGVLLLEIDSGAKLSQSGGRGPFAGALEPTDALNNAGVTTSERVKDFYIAEIKRILTPALDDLGGADLEVAACLAPFRAQLRSALLHVRFQCNHYAIAEDEAAHPAEEAVEREVMTAWALGPDDKAEVVARFLAELGSWDSSKRKVIGDDFDRYRKGYQALRKQAEAKVQQCVLAKDVRIAQEDIEKLGKLVGELSSSARAGKLDDRLIADLRTQVAKRKEEDVQLAKRIAQLDDPQPLHKELAEIDKVLDQLLTTLEHLRKSKTRAEMVRLTDDLDKGAKKVQYKIREYETSVRGRTHTLPLLPVEVRKDSAVEVQKRLDKSAAMDQQLFQMRRKQ